MDMGRAQANGRGFLFLQETKMLIALPGDLSGVFRSLPSAQHPADVSLCQRYFSAFRGQGLYLCGRNGKLCDMS